MSGDSASPVSRLTYRTASTGLTRDLNRSAILRLIGSAGPIARTDIARRLGLSPATVTAVTRELVDHGLVRVAERAPSRGGRPALLLELVGGAATAFGVKVAPDHLVGVRVDLEAEILDLHEVPFDAEAADAVEELGRILAGWLDGGDGRPPLLGVGLGVPGVFDSRSGTLESPLLGWRGVPLPALLRERLGVAVFVDNDVNTLAVAERLYGRGRHVEHFVTVTLGRGVGLGIVTGGDIYRGHRGGAGEFGHVTVVEGGPACSCGKRGCLEALVADPALVAEARRRGVLSPRQGLPRLRALADSGDTGAAAVYGDAGAVLGRAVSGLVNVLGPELVLVSGEGTQSWPHLEPRFEQELRANLFPPLQDVSVEVDPWDDAKWAVGAATLVLRATLTAPLDGEQPSESIRTRLGAGVQTEVVA
jgi:predicted NBD/HSP70 family sugar kinase